VASGPARLLEARKPGLRYKKTPWRKLLKREQIAQALGLDGRTVAKWIEQPCYRSWHASQRVSTLDPYKARVRQWLDSDPYGAQQILQRLRDDGFDGGYSILKEYVRTVRPRRALAFLTLTFAPANAPGGLGAIGLGGRGPDPAQALLLRRGAVLLPHDVFGVHPVAADEAVSRLPPTCLRVFRRFGSGAHHGRQPEVGGAGFLTGQAPVFNPRYLDFGRQYGFTISLCNLGRGNEKGRVVSAVGYVNKDLLNGLESR
jgi:hypothetical protein